MAMKRGGLVCLAALAACSARPSAPSPPAAPRDAPSASASASAAPIALPALSSTIPAAGWSPHKQALHALNRLAYGPRLGETDAVAAAGVEHFIAAQLDPSSLDDGELETKLKSLPTLTMSTAELHERYPRPNKA